MQLLNPNRQALKHKPSRYKNSSPSRSHLEDEAVCCLALLLPRRRTPKGRIVKLCTNTVYCTQKCQALFSVGGRQIRALLSAVGSHSMRSPAPDTPLVPNDAPPPVPVTLTEADWEFRILLRPGQLLIS